MDSEIRSSEHLARGVLSRALVFAALVAIVVQLISTTRLYAVMVVVIAASAVALHDMFRIIERMRRSMERSADELSLQTPVTAAAARRGLGMEARDSEAMQSRLARLEDEGRLQIRDALLDTVTAALFVLQENGAVTLVNRAARRIAAQPVSALSQIAALGKATADSIQAMEPGTRQILHLADGQPVYVSASGFRESGGRNQRLISLQRIAGELDAVEVKAWKDVASVLTHEMMNSLTPIASLSESLEGLLRDTSPARTVDGEISGALEAIKRRSQGLMNFVERYRVVAELPQPRWQLIELDRLFSSIDRLMGATLKDLGVTYRRPSIPPGLSITADADLLEQAVINLIRNAGEAAVGVTAACVTVSCEWRGVELVIAVADNGVGLSEQQLDRIFIPFYTTKPNGSGIGLSLARQVALAHGGRIEVQPNGERDGARTGAVFYLVLPFLTHVRSAFGE